MKKQQQLGMNPGTASNRLVKDLLWNFVESTGKGDCCKCNQPMLRTNFSIEHVNPWLDSEDPVGLFFDIGNISYSHIRCNIADARKPTKTGESPTVRGNRTQRERWSAMTKEQQQQRRRDKYLKYGV